MIEYIRGTLTALSPTDATIETAGGVAYLLNITLPTYSALEGADKVKLLVHENIREDAWTLFGFLDEAERSLFRSLIGVSGVGAGSARTILSAIPASELASVITSGDVRKLKNVKGIGTKTAERIIVDLRDKINSTETTLLKQQSAEKESEIFEEALTALTILGYTRQQSQKALLKIFDAEPDVKLETAIRKALAMM
ncbi:MAG: Holliday junction branch migration protein RuvA [Muribaculaceae bacterium]|jgi:Holliday junction DNA helicase RuvA|nr:Holliday junction branch migration protein RuvA [Muribaculaceae bacterium]